jgi:glycosyltransferase involved in cell wall biosynthesis
MKVLHLVGTLNPGGIERLVTDLAIEQKQHGIQPAVCCLIARQGQFLEALTDIPVFEAPYGKKPWLLPHRLARVLNTWKPDILHSHVNFSLLWQVGAFGFAPRIPFVVTQHTLLRLTRGVIGRSRLIYRIIRPFISCHTAVSEFAAGHARQLYGLQAEKIRIIPNGIHTNRFAFDAAARVRLRDEWGIPADAFLWGSVGRLANVKGYDLLVPAFADAFSGRTDVYCVIAGVGPDGNRLYTSSRMLGCDKVLRLLGQRNDLANVLSALDAYVQPSRKESAGIAVLEALANGLSVLASDTGGLPEIAQRSSHVSLTSPENVSTLSQMLQKITFAKLPRHSDFPVQFTLPVMHQAYSTLYQDILL